MTAEPVEVVEPEPSVADLTPALRPASALVEPAAETDKIEQAFRAYTALCDRLLNADDYQRIGPKQFRKKSGWRKLAVAFGVSCELVDKDYAFNDKGEIQRAECIVRATAPNGRSMDGLGVCHRAERGFSKPEHDIPATAMTRATNRACSDLFGMGEVSAEEVGAAGHPVDDATEQHASKAAIDEFAARVNMAPVPVRDAFQAWKADQSFPWPWPEAAVDAMNAELDRLLAEHGARSEGSGGADEGNLAVPPASDRPSPDPDEAPFEPHGYDLWSAADLELECQARDLPKSGDKQKRVDRLRAWDAANGPKWDVEPSEHPW